MSTITKVKKMITMQKLSFIISCVALTFSVVAFLVANKANYGSMEYELNRGVQPIGNIPDVEIIKADGSVEKLRSVKSQDKLNELMNDKKTNKPATLKNNGIGINNDVARPSNKIDTDRQIAASSKNITDKTISIREAQKTSNKQQNKIRTMVKTNIASPVARQHKGQNKAEGDKTNNETNNIVAAINEKQKQNMGNQEKTQQQSLIKGVVVQIGSFKDRASAEKQCKTMMDKIENKECKIGTFGNLFGSLIVPFRDVDEAKAFDKNVLNKHSIYGYIKNIS